MADDRLLAEDVLLRHDDVTPAEWDADPALWDAATEQVAALFAAAGDPDRLVLVRSEDGATRMEAGIDSGIDYDEDEPLYRHRPVEGGGDA